MINIIRTNDDTNKPFKHWIRPTLVLESLIWLKRNNHAYADVIINPKFIEEATQSIFKKNKQENVAEDETYLYESFIHHENQRSSESTITKRVLSFE